MKRIVIITAVMISSVAGTFFVSNATYNNSVHTVKVGKTDLSANTLIAGKSYIATAD
jgi:uncharacterized protein YxeA